MPNSTFQITGDIGGLSFSSSIARTAPGQIGEEITLNATKAGTLSTRTSDTAGVATLAVGHGLLTSDVVDLYWSGGRRYGATVSGVSGNDVTFSGGAGDNLPVEDDAISLSEQQVIDVDFVGNLLTAIAALCGARAHLGFYESSTLKLSVDLAAGEIWRWATGGTETNPLASANVTSVVATQAGATAAPVKMGLLYASG